MVSTTVWMSCYIISAIICVLSRSSPSKVQTVIKILRQWSPQSQKQPMGLLKHKITSFYVLSGRTQSLKCTVTPPVCAKDVMRAKTPQCWVYEKYCPKSHTFRMPLPTVSMNWGFILMFLCRAPMTKPASKALFMMHSSNTVVHRPFVQLLISPVINSCLSGIHYTNICYKTGTSVEDVIRHTNPKTYCSLPLRLVSIWNNGIGFKRCSGWRYHRLSD